VDSGLHFRFCCPIAKDQRQSTARNHWKSSAPAILAEPVHQVAQIDFGLEGPVTADRLWPEASERLIEKPSNRFARSRMSFCTKLHPLLDQSSA
jgi:hypothetical protein